MTNIISRFCRIKKASTNDLRLDIRTNTVEEQIDNNFASIYKHIELDYPKFFKMDDLSKYGIIAAEYLFENQDWKGNCLDTEIGIVISNASGSLETDLEFHKTINNKERFFPSPAIFVYTLSNIVMGEICIKHKIKGENMFLLSETLPSEQLTNYVSDLLDADKIRVAVVGWVELRNGIPDVLLMYVAKQNTLVEQTMEFSAEQIELLYR